MSISFLAPGFLWALLAIPLVIALHYLHNRRRQQVVSALFLWQQASEQVQVRRRFAPAWLLLLQLLAVALLALALAQPVLAAAGRPDRVLIIDVSASMAAVDGDGLRMDKARAAARELLGGTSVGRLALIRAGSDATVLVPLTDDAGAVAAALGALQGADTGADLERALELARLLAPAAELHVISDAPPPAGTDFTYHGVAGGGFNVGITTFDLGVQQAFIALTSSWPRPQAVPLQLLRDGQLIASADVLVPAGGQGNVSLPLGTASGMFEARISVPQGDALQLDDSAFAGVRPLHVVFSGRSEALSRALLAVPGVTLSPGGSGDVHVLTGSDPASLPAGNHLLLAAPAAEPEYELIRDWDQADPLLRFVDLRDTVVGVDPARPALDAGEGWRVLARDSDFEPVIRARGSAGSLTVQLAFHPNQTDLVYRPAFPALIANIMEAFRGQPALRLGESLPAGSTLEGQPVLRVLQPGVYQLPGGAVAASLLTASETRIPGPLPTGALPEGVRDRQDAAAREAGGPDTQQRGIAWWLLLPVPLLLAAEWFAWGRRAG